MVGRLRALPLLAVAALFVSGCLGPSLGDPSADEWEANRVSRPTVTDHPAPARDWPDDPDWTTPAPRQASEASPTPTPAASDPDEATPAAGWTPASRSPRTPPPSKPWSTWESERDAHGPAGLAATIDLLGDGARLEGPLELGATSLRLTPAPLFPESSRLAFLGQATVHGVGSGLVLLEGNATASATAPMRLAAENVTLHGESLVRPALAFGGLPEPVVPDGWEGARGAFFTRNTSLALDHATVQGYARGLLVQGNESTPLSGPIVVSASSIHWADGSTASFMRGTLAASGAFTFAADAASGSVQPEGRDAVTDVRGFVASGGVLQVDSGRLRDAGGVRVTQVVTGAGFALPATVQVLPHASQVTVARNGTAWVKLHYRESGFAGDAVLSSVEATGNGSQAIELPLRPPPSMVESMFGILDSVSALPPAFAALPVVALALGLTIAAPFVALAETLLCMLDGCPQKSTYPSYMGAGEVGVAYLKVHPDLPPGTYDTTVTLHGANHADASFPLQVTVT